MTVSLFGVSEKSELGRFQVFDTVKAKVGCPKRGLKKDLRCLIVLHVCVYSTHTRIFNENKNSAVHKAKKIIQNHVIKNRFL